MISAFFSMIFEGSGSVFAVSVRSIFNQFCHVFTKFGILLATSSVFSSAIISSTSSFIIGSSVTISETLFSKNEILITGFSSSISEDCSVTISSCFIS